MLCVLGLGVRQHLSSMSSGQETESKSVEQRICSIETAVKAMELRMMHGSSVFKDFELQRWLHEELRAWDMRIDDEYGLREVEHLRDEWLLSRALRHFEEPKIKWQLLLGSVIHALEVEVEPRQSCFSGESPGSPEDIQHREAMKFKLCVLEKVKAREKRDNPQVPEYLLTWQWISPEVVSNLAQEEEKARRLSLAQAVLKA